MAVLSTTASEQQSSAVGHQDISGFADYSELEHIHMHTWMKSLSEIFNQHGFSPFYPRPTEKTTMLTKKGGITGQIYVIGRLQNNEITDLALPFDRTVPMALWINRHASNVLFPYKRFDISLSWRGEHAQRGRFRAFYQADVDTVAKKLTLVADAECITTIWHGLESLGVKNFHMCLNHMTISKALIKELHPEEEQINQLLVIVDKIDKISKELFLGELQEVLPQTSIEALTDFYEKIHFKGRIQEFSQKLEGEGEKAFQKLNRLFSLIDAYHVDASKLQFCPSMVRGLNYYTGAVFETFLDDLPQVGSIASGGRYDDLVERVAEQSSKKVEGLQGVGGSIGLTRLFDTIKDRIPETARTTSDVFIGYRNDPGKLESFQLRAIDMACKLRELGIKVDIQTDCQKKMKDLFAYTSKKGYPFVISIMDEHSVVIKNMSNREQRDFPEDQPIIEIFSQKCTTK